MEPVVRMVKGHFLFSQYNPGRDATIQKQNGNMEAFISGRHFGHSP